MADQDMKLLRAPWDRITLQSLAQTAAEAAPSEIFLRDCPLRESWNDSEPRKLTFAEFFKAAGFLAAQLRTLGVAHGDRVMMLLPNCVELPIALLGAHLAGAIPAIAPIDEKVDTLRAMAERSEASAILTTARVGEIAVGEKARQVAARLLTVRCVGGFGFNLPDGIVSLEGWSEEDILPAPAVARRQEEIALVTFSRHEGAICAITRTEAQLVAEALAASLVLPLSGGKQLLSLMQPGAAASVAAGLVLPLQTQAGVQLVGPFETMAFDAAREAVPGASLLAPDHFVAQLASTPGEEADTVLAITRASALAGILTPPGQRPAALLVDFDERGIMTLPHWPADGTYTLPARFEHPLPDLLPEGAAHLVRDDAGLLGFGAAGIIEKAKAGAAGKAA